MGTLILDASVLIGLLDSSDPHHPVAVNDVEAADQAGAALQTPASAYSEALVAFARADRVTDARESIAGMGIAVAPLTAEIGERAAGLRAEHERLRLPDALVLATARGLGADLLTYDDRLSRIANHVPNHEQPVTTERGTPRGLDRAAAIAILDRLHAAQNTFYGGGDEHELRALLDPSTIWTVPGTSPIAGTYRGIEQVFGYFAGRRERAGGTFRMHRRDVLSGDGARIAALTDGTAQIGAVDHEWSTVGLYEITPKQLIGACWLLPLDQAAFDAIWSS